MNNKEDAAYCISCGASLKTAKTNEGVFSSSGGTRAFDVQVAWGGGGVARPYSDPSQITYGKGCISSAWNDLRSSEGWIHKMLLLGLVGLVPILNFVVYGYAMRWTGDLVKNGASPLPRGIFEDGAFAKGFYWVVLSVLFCLLASIVGFIVGLIPFLGVVIALVLALFLVAFQCLCAMRIAITGRFGAGFEWGTVWNSYKRRVGSLLGAACVPSIIVMVIAGLVVGIVAAICAVAFGSELSCLAYVAAYGTSVNSSIIGGAGLVIMLLFLLTSYVCVCLSATSVVWTFRAVGHWVSRFSPEWAYEGDYFSGAYAANGFSGGWPVNAEPGQPVAGSYGQVAPSYVPPVPVPAVAPVANPVPETSPRTAAINGDDPDRRTTVLPGSGSDFKTVVLVRSNGEQIALSSFPATIGKGTAADVRITGNGSISRVHARVIYATGTFAIEDAGSTNGTRINGSALGSGEVVALHDGDRIKLGGEELTVSIRSSAPGR